MARPDGLEAHRIGLNRYAPLNFLSTLLHSAYQPAGFCHMIAGEFRKAWGCFSKSGVRFHFLQKRRTCRLQRIGWQDCREPGGAGVYHPAFRELAARIDKIICFRISRRFLSCADWIPKTHPIFLQTVFFHDWSRIIDRDRFHILIYSSPSGRRSKVC